MGTAESIENESPTSERLPTWELAVGEAPGRLAYDFQ